MNPGQTAEEASKYAAEHPHSKKESGCKYGFPHILWNGCCCLYGSTVIKADPGDGVIGLFGFVGTVPDSSLFKGATDMDDNGYILTDEDMRTNIPGVFVAGDVRKKSLRQVITAAADGATAAVMAGRYIAELDA